MDIELESIARQLAEATATSWDGEHLVLLDPVTILLPDLNTVSAMQASAWLSMGEWVSTHPCSAHQDCVLWSHVTTVTPITDDEVDQLVRKASRPSLASLYKRARQTGLVPASTAGYF